MSKLYPKNCIACSKDYMGVSRSIYCSRACSASANKTKFEKGITPWNKGKTGITLTEEQKKKISLALKGKMPSNFENMQMIGWESNLGRKASLQTRKKMSDAHKGENAYQWQGGITRLQSQIRNSFEYRQWRSDVFTRDNFTCQECEQRGGRLQADHINPFSVIFHKNGITSRKEALACEEFWNINNGRTLCESCHKKTDTYLSGAIKYKKAILSPLQVNNQ